MATDGRQSRSCEGNRDAERTSIRGVSFWRLSGNGRTTELNTQDEVVFGSERASWSVAPLPGEGGARVIDSSSPAVHGFLRRVAAEKMRLARLGRPIGPPLAKPTSGGQPLPGHAPVPCPLCRPGADASRPGEAWFDCELCDGEGTVTARQAEAWHERGARPGRDDDAV